MGRVKKEENPNTETIIQDVELDVTPQEEMKTEIPLPKTETKPSYREKKEPSYSNETVNCLRNERIIVRFVPNPTAMVQRKGHILYGGMAENATRSFVVPRLSKTGMFKNVLTDSEKSFLEKAMGLEINALSIYKKENNFWDDSNPNGIGRVTLHKQDNYLDLSIPEQYIQYKILLANKDYIAASMEELEERPKATYQFVIISEGAEAQKNLSRMDITMMCRCFLSLFVLSCLFSETFKEKVSSHAIAKNHIQWFASIFPYPDLGSIVKCKSDSRAVISKNHFIIRFPKLFSYFAMIVTIVVLLENPHFRYFSTFEKRNVCRTKGIGDTPCDSYKCILLADISTTA